jgi:hypothetical protein
MRKCYPRLPTAQERMTTTEALRLGLIHLVVGEGELDATCAVGKRA